MLKGFSTYQSFCAKKWIFFSVALFMRLFGIVGVHFL